MTPEQFFEDKPEQFRLEVAEVMIRGFKCCLTMTSVSARFGMAEEVIAAACPFFPQHAYESKTPIRAYFAANWPKLNDYLIRNEKNLEKMEAAAPQLARLRQRAVRGQVIASKDRQAVRRSERLLAHVEAENRIARSIQESTQRGAWNVCKR